MARFVLHDAAVADGRSDSLHIGVCLSISDGKIDWIRPNDDADLTRAEVFDAGGATIVPALVDGPQPSDGARRESFARASRRSAGCTQAGGARQRPATGASG